MHDSEQFFIVWNPGGKNPTYRHVFESDALKEAERLATLNPCTDFYVACVTDRVCIERKPLHTKLKVYIPF